MMISKKQVQFLIKLKQKKYRDQHRKFLLENPKVIWEDHQNKLLDSVYVTEEFFKEHESKMVFDNVFVTSNADMKKISEQVNPVGMVALYDMPDNKNFNFKSQNVILLDTIQDPGNMGTIIRTADWYGIGDIILSKNCVDIYNPKVVSATMGSVFNVNLHMDYDLGKISEDLKKHKYKIVASDLQGSDNLPSKDKIAIIIGNESKGISKDLLAIADVKYKIKKYGRAESLNASVAAGVIMHEIKNKQE